VLETGDLREMTRLRGSIVTVTDPYRVESVVSGRLNLSVEDVHRQAGGHASRPEAQHATGNTVSEVHVVGGQQDRLVGLDQDVLDHGSGTLIQVGDEFIKEERLLTGDENPSECETPLLSTRKMMGARTSELIELHQSQHRVDTSPDLGRRQSSQLQGIGEVLCDASSEQ